MTPDDVGLPFEEVRLDTEDGERLHAWWLPAEEERAVVLFCHGNAGNISGRLGTLRAFHRLGLSTFIFDYRGYGRSTGSPSEAGLYLDAETAWTYLTRNRGIEPDRIVVFGRSLGGGVATWLAARYEPRMLVLEATFTSIPDVAAELYPFVPARLFVRARFDNSARLHELDVPLLILHSRDDAIIPFAQGRRLYEAAAGPKTFVETAGMHGMSLYEDEPRYLQALTRFLAAHGVPTKTE